MKTRIELRTILLIVGPASYKLLRSLFTLVKPANLSTSSRSRVISASMTDSTASKVQQNFQTKCFTLSASRPDNIAVVKKGKNVRLEVEKKERLREKPRKATKEIEATGDLTNHVNVVGPGECHSPRLSET